MSTTGPSSRTSLDISKHFLAVTLGNHGPVGLNGLACRAPGGKSSVIGNVALPPGARLSNWLCRTSRDFPPRGWRIQWTVTVIGDGSRVSLKTVSVRLNFVPAGQLLSHSRQISTAFGCHAL